MATRADVMMLNNELARLAQTGQFMQEQNQEDRYRTQALAQNRAAKLADVEQEVLNRGMQERLHKERMGLEGKQFEAQKEHYQTMGKHAEEQAAAAKALVGIKQDEANNLLDLRKAQVVFSAFPYMDKRAQAAIMNAFGQLGAKSGKQVVGMEQFTPDMMAGPKLPGESNPAAKIQELNAYKELQTAFNTETDPAKKAAIQEQMDLLKPEGTGGYETVPGGGPEGGELRVTYKNREMKRILLENRAKKANEAEKERQAQETGAANASIIKPWTWDISGKQRRALINQGGGIQSTNLPSATNAQPTKPTTMGLNPSPDSDITGTMQAMGLTPQAVQSAAKAVGPLGTGTALKVIQSVTNSPPATVTGPTGAATGYTSPKDILDAKNAGKLTPEQASAAYRKLYQQRNALNLELKR